MKRNKIKSDRPLLEIACFLGKNFGPSISRAFVTSFASWNFKDYFFNIYKDL